MLDEIHALLDALKLRHARAAVAEQLKAAQKQKTSYSAFLLELLRREHEGQRDRTMARRLKHSGLQEYWTLETFPFHIQKCLDKRLIDELAELDFIDRGQSVVFIGQPAVGKSGLASGIMMKALYAGRRCQAVKADELFDELGKSHADRTTRARLQRLARLDLLLIEEFGFISPLEPRQVNAFFRLMDDRCNRRSTMITSNLGFDEWEKFLGGSALVAALVSRLLQNCKTIMFPKEAAKLRNPKLRLPARAQRPAILDAA
jgi:DNA replication protein DnaC